MRSTQLRSESAIARKIVGTMRAYAHLVKVYFWDYYLAYFLIVSLLPAARWNDRMIAALIFFAAGAYLLHSATVAFDDITGFKDGSDAQNYRANPSKLRRVEWKPLVTGELKLPQAQRFSWVCLIVGLLLLCTGVMIAPYHPVWLCVIGLTGPAIIVQYSYGLKFSYIGGQELVLFSVAFLLVVTPYLLLTGTLSRLCVFEATLFAFWLMMVSIYSNLHDRDTDADSGRVNLATITSSRNYARLLGILVGVDVLLVIIHVALGAVPWLFLPLLYPVFILRLIQFRTGVLSHNPLAARLLGRRLARVGVLLLTLRNVWLALNQN